MATKQLPGKEEISFLVVVRGLACLLVVWDHLVGIWTTQHKIDFIPLTFVRHYITRPLGIIQDFGYLGVVLFFFVSGFVITHVAQRENWRTFIVKRLLRIYPPFVVSVVVTVLLHWLYAYCQAAGFSLGPYFQYDASISRLPWSDIALAMTLLNYFKVQHHLISGVAWTLVIEVIFYLLCFCVLPLIQRRPPLVGLALSALCLLIMLVDRRFGPHFFLFAASVASVPLLLIGQATYFFWSGRTTRRWFIASAFANAAIYFYSILNLNDDAYLLRGYSISVIYGYCIFAVLLMLNNYVRVPRVVHFYSKISYSLYLYHGLIGFATLGILYQFVSYPLALVAAFAASSGVAYLSWKYIEVPSQQLARHFLGRLAPRVPIARPIGSSAE